jgi:hypothetical protein
MVKGIIALDHKEMKIAVERKFIYFELAIRLSK